MTTTIARAGLILAAVVLAAGCADSMATKSGVDPAPMTLVLANNDGMDLDGAPGVEHFVDRIEELSNGTVDVSVESAWKGGADETQVLRDVAAGEADLGWSGTRALDRVGVTSLTPLNAAFLVDSYRAQQAVLADPEVQAHVEDLDDAGLVGLALVADELRLPVGSSRPLLRPADFRGAVIRTAASGIQRDGLAALGARPTFESWDVSMDGLETMWWAYNENLLYDEAIFPTINVGLWPRSVILFANPETMDGLSEEAHGWVLEAAADAAQWSRDHARDREADQIVAACKGGARIATATAEQIEALKAKAQPLYQRLREDPATADMFTRVEQLAARAPKDEHAALPDGCAFQPGDETLAPDRPLRLTAPGDPGDLPQGVYRFELTPAYLRDVGLAESAVRDNAGVMTYMLSDGRWSYEQQPREDNIVNTTCEGFYDVDGKSFTASGVTKEAVGECAPPLWTASWSFNKGTLSWTDVSIDDFAPVFAGEHGWQKIE